MPEPAKKQGATSVVKWMGALGLTLAVHVAGAGVVFDRVFSPLEGMVSLPEQPFRQEMCLNGFWQFQPAEIPHDWKSGTGVPPGLALPQADDWERIPIKIPSPWNVNAIGHDPLGGGMDGRTYPSYPEAWNNVRMGWLRKSVTIPAEWEGQRVYLHLEAVAGDCRILVNAREIGFHFDVALPGQFDITHAVKWGRENEILLGIRDHRLYAEKGTCGTLTYPTGSFWLMEAIGVWQDVFLLAKPPVQVSDIFVQSWLEKDLLVVDVELANHSPHAQAVELQFPVFEWRNHADLSKQNRREAPESAWSLGGEAMRLSAGTVTLEPGEGKTLRLQGAAQGRLKTWEPWNRGTPHLYMGTARIRANGQLVDVRAQRFGWREVKLENGDFYLNGEPVKLMHDFWHFTGVANMSRRYAWSWYTLAMDAHVNYIRPHAMPFPRYFYDLADEMGMLIMDETGVFASHCDLNYDSEDLWTRSAEHVKRLVRRDRNHPSILGWSVANEVWCVLRSRADPAYQEKVYDQIEELRNVARSLDPTRQWIQSDGDKDLNGRLDVWTIHCGSEHNDQIPPDKLWGVTEGGSAYFGKPDYYKTFAGDRVYRSFNDRLDALGRECYHLIRTLREQDADICSAVNLVWHGLKPLPLGLDDVSKRQIPLTDGVFFGPYQEGQPGVQPERIPPFSTTVNPGYDPGIPLCDPNPLYLALQASMHPAGPQACEWDHFETSPALPDAPVIADPVDQVCFAGSRSGMIYENLVAMGVPFIQAPLEKPEFMIIDVSSIEAAALDAASETANRVVAEGGTVLLVGLSPATESIANQLLPQNVVCREDAASSLVPNGEDARTACLSYEELYFAESYMNKIITRSSLGGEFVRRGHVLLSRNDTEWLRWLNGPEYSKTISIVRSELENTQTPVLVELKQGKGAYLASTLEMARIGGEHVALYRQLLANLGVRLAENADLTISAFDGPALVRALTLGRFGAGTLQAAMDQAFIEEASLQPVENEQTAGQTWTVASNAGDRFVFRELRQSGPEARYATYFSYWVYSPIDLGDL
ncbi:MAG: hypothetical protein MUC91_01550, partial [Verrucomicrobia bacterium]|nr:hypothetical protein [Verrucomicrobiota bacterium]